MEKRDINIEKVLKRAKAKIRNEKTFIFYNLFIFGLKKLSHGFINLLI